jgi:hypothetical protein
LGKKYIYKQGNIYNKNLRTHAFLRTREPQSTNEQTHKTHTNKHACWRFMTSCWRFMTSCTCGRIHLQTPLVMTTSGVIHHAMNVKREASYLMNDTRSGHNKEGLQVVITRRVLVKSGVWGGLGGQFPSKSIQNLLTHPPPTPLTP